MSERAVAGLPPTVHLKSIVVELAELCTLRSGHDAGSNGPAIDCSIWSVAASMHCLMTRAGALTFSMLVLTSHRPGLRDGNSEESAGTALARRRAELSTIRRMTVFEP